MTEHDDATLAQIAAARPDRSTWLSASAGSGKTKVLIDRVARLLLEGADPRHILCLTYTKAAASEMQNRLFERLGGWVMLDDRQLVEELRGLGHAFVITDDTLARARRLFAAAIEVPGGLKIQTIHSFCSAILRRFPLEAGVTPLFVEIDERASALLRDEVTEAIARGEKARTLREIARLWPGETLDGLTREIAARRGFFEDPASFSDVLEALSLPSDSCEADAVGIAFDGSEATFWPELLGALSGIGGKLYPALAERLAEIDIARPGLADLERLFDEFLYKRDDPKGQYRRWQSRARNFPPSNHRNAVEALSPVVGALHALMDRVAEAKQALLKLSLARRTKVLHEFARVFLLEYGRAKERRGWLDFDDLILRTRDLLSDRDVADWVLFKLDGGVDHILIDEAQDTSPVQWQVIERLAQEIISGLGARPDRPRTIFVVGDKKQSIYSFQGADPHAFDQMKESFKAQLAESQTPLQDREMVFSFRSAPAILALVDACFEGHETSGFAADLRHRAHKSDMPGRVDLWPAVAPPEKEEEPDWHDPVDIRSPANPATVLAREIARAIRDMLGAPLPDASGNATRPIRPGDIMILVQRRSEVFHDIIRECKARGLPVAGADRLRIGGELAVRDLRALLSFLATPEDSLSLAGVLRSPLFGWSEEALFRLAHHRQETHLWAALRARGEAFPETLAVLRDLRDHADYLRPYELLERVLTRHDGRRRLLGRLGPEAEDGIDALLAQALAYERSAVDSLTGFLVWMEADDLEIKRRMDSAGDMIRVMTVHGAKGLEAPIVILPDTAKRQIRPRGESLAHGKALLWRAPTEAAPATQIEAEEAVRRAEQAERDRLLYVGLTRAEQWLIVAAAGDTGEDGRGWHDKVRAGLERLEAAPHEFPTGTGLRLQSGNWRASLAGGEEEGGAEAPVELPGFLTRPAPAPDRPPATLSPSELGGAKALPGEDGLDEEAAKARGSVIHRLLELLPDHRQADWPAIAERVAGSAFAPGPLLAEAAAVLGAPGLAPLFGPGSLCEVPVSASLGILGGRRVHGVIDRLVIRDDAVLAVDFKTNAAVPSRPEDCPEGLLRQMGAYAHALGEIYPGRRIETALVWTRTASLMELPHDLVTAALRDTQMS